MFSLALGCLWLFSVIFFFSCKSTFNRFLVEVRFFTVILI